MPEREAPRARRVCLDIVRGLAALAVAAGHLRNFMFAGADRASSPAWKAFMIVTEQGHAAVVVFFVLSGYLIGGNVIGRLARGRWSWGEYAVDRLTRLWIVLIPALLLTFVLDEVGRRLLAGALYLGKLDAATYASIPTPRELVLNHSAATFLGNVLFLQNGILVGAYGLNAPLWSLANEFWYYALFPLAVIALRGRGEIAGRIVCAALVVAIGTALPWPILAYGLIWLLGALVAVLDRFQGRLASRRARLLLSGAMSLVVLASLYVVPRFSGLGPVTADFILAVLFAILAFLIVGLDPIDNSVVRILTALSEVSYTLYLTHFPFFALVLCAIDDNRRFAPSVASGLLYAALLASSLVYAFAVYWMTERHTRTVQTRLRRLVARRTLRPVAR